MSDYDVSDYDEDDKQPNLPPIRSLLSRRTVATPYRRWDPILGEWRNAVRFGRQEVTDEQKGAFLEEYLKWGRLTEAAAVAGVSANRIKALAQEDEEFAEALTLAESAYRDKLIQHHQNLLFNGTEKVSYDRNGNVVSREQIYPIRLIEMELKKHDQGYRDKQEIEMKHSGGVLIAPTEMASIEDWERKFAEKLIDVTPEAEEEDASR